MIIGYDELIKSPDKNNILLAYYGYVETGQVNKGEFCWHLLEKGLEKQYYTGDDSDKQFKATFLEDWYLFIPIADSQYSLILHAEAEKDRSRTPSFLYLDENKDCKLYFDSEFKDKFDDYWTLYWSDFYGAEEGNTALEYKHLSGYLKNRIRKYLIKLIFQYPDQVANNIIELL